MSNVIIVVLIVVVVVVVAVVLMVLMRVVVVELTVICLKKPDALFGNGLLGSLWNLLGLKKASRVEVTAS